MSIYYKAAGELQCSSLCMILDGLKHDTITVHALFIVYNCSIVHQGSTFKGSCRISEPIQKLQKSDHLINHGLDAEWHFCRIAWLEFMRHHWWNSETLGCMSQPSGNNRLIHYQSFSDIHVQFIVYKYSGHYVFLHFGH